MCNQESREQNETNWIQKSKTALGLLKDAIGILATIAFVWGLLMLLGHCRDIRAIPDADASTLIFLYGISVALATVIIGILATVNVMMPVYILFGEGIYQRHLYSKKRRFVHALSITAAQLVLLLMFWPLSWLVKSFNIDPLFGNLSYMILPLAVGVIASIILAIRRKVPWHLRPVVASSAYQQTVKNPSRFRIWRALFFWYFISCGYGALVNTVLESSGSFMPSVLKLSLLLTTLLITNVAVEYATFFPSVHEAIRPLAGFFIVNFLVFCYANPTHVAYRWIGAGYVWCRAGSLTLREEAVQALSQDDVRASLGIPAKGPYRVTGYDAQILSKIGRRFVVKFSKPNAAAILITVPAGSVSYEVADDETKEIFQ
jgi:hypothetical protein